MKRMISIKEALSDGDQQEILDLQRDILDSKEDLLNTDADEKENIKQRIDDLKQQIDDIKQANQESVQEEFLDGAITSTLSGKTYVEIYHNPTERELREAFFNDLSAQNYGDLRGILLASGSLLIGVSKEAELIHDQLLKLLDNKNYVSYVSSWETESINKFLAVFIYPNGTVSPSENSYLGILDIETLHSYKASIERKNPHLEFDSDISV